MNRNVKWVAVAVAVAVFALVAGNSVNAKPSFVKGASCKTCHEAKPAKKDNINAKAAAMVKKYKTDECKNCHGWDDGKFTTKKK